MSGFSIQRLIRLNDRRKSMKGKERKIKETGQVKGAYCRAPSGLAFFVYFTITKEKRMIHVDLFFLRSISAGRLVHGVS